ncbi:MAG: radical SAM protein [Candidatus Lokiarchaeota archaeon]|nr:radical SAM protein [Candidatus Lokiarchaeota archaeon]
MKILYVNPSRISAGLDYVVKGPPLGLISIAAMVPEHDATLLDYKIQKYNETRFKRILNHHDVVAITSMTPQISNAFDVAKIAKEQGCKTIIGGYQPTLTPEYVAGNSYVDYAVRGEGEHTFREIIEFLDGDKKKLSIKDIDGISYRDNEGRIIHNKDRDLEPNLDNFPMPRRDLLDDKKYIYLGARVAQLESSRGCPHSCKFCCIIKMWKSPSQKITYRTKSIKRVMQEVYDIDWKNDFIFFCEDNFTIKVKRTKEILETIIRSGVPDKMYFSCQSRVDTLYRNPWLIDLMDKAGMRQVFLGIETVHQQSLNAMNKRNTTPAMTRKVVKMLQDRGISIFGGVIIGFPGENKTMVRQTIQFTKSLKLTCVQFTPITAFPGTDFYEEMKQEGKITSNNYKHYNLFYSMMNTDELSSKDMYRLVVEAYSAYYLSGEWMKALAMRYCNPFGKFNWMGLKIPRFIRKVIKSGFHMMRSQGFTTSNVSDELKNLKEKAKLYHKKTGRTYEIENDLPLIPIQKKEKLIPSQEKILSN